MKHYLKKKVLLQTSQWFTGPDGRDYKAVWGTLTDVIDVTREWDLRPARTHANWMLQVGNMTIQGCEVKYVIECPERPAGQPTTAWTVDGGKYIDYSRPNIIYFAE